MPPSAGSGGPESGDGAAIRLEGVSVRYRIPSDRIFSFKEYVLSRLSGRLRFTELWALEDLNLEVAPGEMVGVIGQNGSGKSTLLKVVSRVLNPTRGRVVVRGHVAPLLELGAGFHPDLSGRENYYLNASILGFPRDRLENGLDEVIEFSELAPFIDAPLRTYSSGMYARLGFAVATLVRPDVLLLDEVLAVGDLTFRDRCFERLAGFRAAGTTTLLVTHDLGTVESTCDWALWIKQGRAERVGDPSEVVAAYRADLGGGV